MSIQQALFGPFTAWRLFSCKQKVKAFFAGFGNLNGVLFLFLYYHPLLLEIPAWPEGFAWFPFLKHGSRIYHLFNSSTKPRLFLSVITVSSTTLTLLLSSCLFCFDVISSLFWTADCISKSSCRETTMARSEKQPTAGWHSTNRPQHIYLEHKGRPREEHQEKKNIDKTNNKSNCFDRGLKMKQLIWLGKVLFRVRLAHAFCFITIVNSELSKNPLHLPIRKDKKETMKRNVKHIVKDLYHPMPIRVKWSWGEEQEFP